jgi:hypothetical protein
VALATKPNMINPSSTITQPTCHFTISSTDLWHNRLGHTSPSWLHFIAKFFLKISIQSNTICSICPLAKQSHLPFNPSVISSTKPFAMIHYDIWGPYRHPSLSGAHYFLTVVDDFTRFTWIFLMKHKNEAQSLLKIFFNYVLIQFEVHIKILQSDNGGEFLSLCPFLQEK